MQQNTLITEIGMIMLAALLVIGGVVLIFFGKITFVEFSPFLIAVLGIFGINVAWKAPSPSQAQQLNNQQQQIAHVQEAIAPLTGMAHIHADPVPMPVQLQPQAPTNTLSPAAQPYQEPQTPIPQFQRQWTPLEVQAVQPSLTEMSTLPYPAMPQPPRG